MEWQYRQHEDEWAGVEWGVGGGGMQSTILNMLTAMFIMQN